MHAHNIHTNQILVKTKTSKRHQTVVPSEIRELWGINGPMVLEWTYIPETNKVEIDARPTQIDEWIKTTSGKYSTSRTKEEIDEYMDQMRSEWDK